MKIDKKQGEYSSPICETITVMMETTILSGNGWGDGIGEVDAEGDF